MRMDGMPLSEFTETMECNAEQVIRATELILQLGGDPSSYAVTADGKSQPYTLRMSKATHKRLRAALRKEAEADAAALRKLPKDGPNTAGSSNGKR